MDAKDLRTESTLSERNNDGKYGPSGTSIQCTKTKTYQDIGSSSSNKVDSSIARPCAVIGPDRVIPTPATEAYLKKATVEPWTFFNNGYRRPPDYPNKLPDYQNQIRNISPRQTYQENMQRIMVPPTYSSVKVNEDFNQTSDRNSALPSRHSIKLNVVPENKYCEVPYNNNTAINQKSGKNAEINMSNVNPPYQQLVSQSWTPGCVSAHPPRGYGATDLYRYPEFSSCIGSRQVPISRSHRTAQEDPGYVYSDPYYQNGNMRFRPYPNAKDRYPQARYEFVGNYSNPFYPTPVPPHKYDIHKSVATPYPTYNHLKGLESRMSEPIMEGYHRVLPPGNYNIPFRNPVIHPPYGSIITNCQQGKMPPPYLSESAPKTPVSNKPPYDVNSNVYIDYENSRLKGFPTPETLYSNEMRLHSINNQMVMPNYPSINMHSIAPHSYCNRDSVPMKNHDFSSNLKNMDPLLNVINPMSHHLSHFSPGAIPISPTNSNGSNDTTHYTHSGLHEDSGYVSQSSGGSIKSIDSAIYRNNELHRRYYDPRYRPILRASQISKQENQSGSLGYKDKKQIDVRQFLQMWNEGDEENGENNIGKESSANPDSQHIPSPYDSANNHEQLYVLGLVNVSSEDLSKYEHIQTVSKLPENIKGYNSIELLNQFEEVIESTNMNYYKANNSKENKMAVKPNVTRQTPVVSSRPLSPLDVEAKISQSVIHKEVGCNFEIRPCSPKMLNADLATPVQSILNERVIEKLTNPLSNLASSKSPIMKLDENIDNCHIIKNQHHVLLDEHIKAPSCKLANAQYPDSVECLKNNYTFQDLESSSGLCLASLPRLDNDMELNFPEVNQQFINANKSESLSIQSAVNNPLHQDKTCENQVQDKKDNECLVSNFADEHERQFSKLSKFRKNKSNGLDITGEGFQLKTIRTDSVIIKNPENVKNLEINDEHFPISTLTNDNQLSPMNLTSQCDKVDITEDDITRSNLDTGENDDDTDKNNSGELAIDFSFNKNYDIESSKDNDLATENLVPMPKINSEEHETGKSKNKGASLSSDFHHKEECTSSTLMNEEVNHFEIMEDKVHTKSYFNMIQTNDCTISEEKKVEVVQNIAPNIVEETDKHKSIIFQCNKTDTQYSILETFVTTEKKCDEKAIDQVSDVLSPVQDHLKVEKIINKSDVNNRTDFEDGTNVINVVHHGTDTTKNVDGTEINNDCGSLIPLLKTSEKAFISELPDFPQQNNANIFYTKDSVSEDLIPKIPETQVIQQKPFLEERELKFEDDDEKCDDMKADSSQREKDVNSRKDVISKLTDESNQEVSVGNANKNATLRSNLELYNINSEQNIINVQLNTIITKDKDLQLNSITTIIPELSDTFSSNKDMILESQKIETNILSPQLIDTKVKVGETEILDDSCVFTSKSSEEEIDSRDQGDQFTIKNNVNEIEFKEASNTANLQHSFIELNTMTKIDDGTCLKNYVTDQRNLIEVNGCYLDNIVNSEDKTFDLNNLDNKELCNDNRQQKTVFEESSTDSKKTLVQNDFNHVSNIIECPNLDNNFSDICILNSEISSLFNGAEKGKTESVQGSENIPRDLGKAAKNKTEVSMDENSYINEQLFNNKNKDVRQTDISKSLQSLGHNLGIHQTTVNNSESLKLIVSNQNVSPIHPGYNSTHKIFFRKNLYSPYVQNLLTFIEGRCNNSHKIYKPYNDENLQKDAIVAQWDNLNLKSNNTETKDQSFSHSTGRNSTKKSVLECSRLVDYDSSDSSLSPFAIEFKSQTKLDENVNCEKSLKESPEIIDIELEIKKSRNMPILETTKLHLKNASIDESAGENVNTKISNIDIEYENISNSELKNDNNKLIDIKHNNIFDLVEDTHCQYKDKSLIETENGVVCQFGAMTQHSLKRSLSDSALYNFTEEFNDKSTDNIPYTWPFKRKKLTDTLTKPSIITENFANVINSNRRNSISSTYTDENVSFCIIIDNDCIITEEDNDSKLCYTEVSESLMADIPHGSILQTDSVMKIIPAESKEDNICEYSDSYVMECDQARSPTQWVDDVACVETVISDDIAEDIVISATSPNSVSDNDEPEVFFSHATEHTDIVKHIYGDKLCQNDAEFVETLYKTPQMDVNKTLIHRESEDCDKYYDRESLERVLSEENHQGESPYSPTHNDQIVFCPISPYNKYSSESFQETKNATENEKNREVDKNLGKHNQQTQDGTIHSCESSIDNVFSYSTRNESINRLTSSSPEVSSTTSEEKESSILLKITNFKGSIVSQISEYNSEIGNENVCLTDRIDALNRNDKLYSKKPLITKGAQKYIPPLKETIRDLKVQISLPQDSLNKLKQMKMSKEELKHCPHNTIIPHIVKKPKPKFEDVLKSIDEIQFKMHKEKNKKIKKSIPKVVIKKSLNGSHYASTKNKDTFNPDLTGRKWQPWVFIERNSFIDKMAIKKKTKAIFSHRKDTYVLAEKFYKYKSVNSATFVITQPTYSKPSSGGQLKYTIRLKHSY